MIFYEDQESIIEDFCSFLDNDMIPLEEVIFDQKHQVYEMIPLPLDSLEFNTPNQFDVMLKSRMKRLKSERIS